MKKLYLILLVLIIILAFLQTSALPVFGVGLDVMLPFVLVIVYVAQDGYGIKFAFLAGLVLDLIGTQRFGMFTFIYTVCAILEQYALRLIGKRLHSLAVIAFIFAILEQLVFAGPSSVKRMVIGAVWPAIFTLVFYPGVRMLREKF